MGYHILIADDEERIVTSMSQIIGDAFGEQVEIRTASNGLNCIGIMKEWKTDFLITDIRMPGLNGIELVKKLRETDKEVDILVISAYEDFEYARKLIPYGVIDYLVKPISVNKILNMVQQVMEKEYAGVQKKEIIPEKQDQFRTRALIREAEEYIRRELYSPLSLADVAEALHVNKSYLSNTFKNEKGENISNFINDVKIKEAKRLLLETEESVSEISEKLGYNTPKYFIEKFSKSTGMTPARFRKLLYKSIK